jgi:hypothetical protein
VAHTCNPSYSGGRDQEDHSSRAARANSSTRSYLKKTLQQKRAGGVAQDVGPEFKPQYHKNKTKQNHKIVKENYQELSHMPQINLLKRN